MPSARKGADFGAISSNGRGGLTAVRKLRRTSLSLDAYAFVRELFTNGTRYKPGEKISVEELSRELGVSRTQLWGAINRLEAEGIVEIVPRQGVYLIENDPDRVLEIYRAREGLRGHGRTSGGRERHRSPNRGAGGSRRGATKAAGENRLRRLLCIGFRFHEQIAVLAQNRTLAHLLASILAQIRAMDLQHDYMPMHLPRSCEDHDKLIEALRERNPDRAEHEARTHMRDLFEEIRRTLQAQPAIAVPRTKTSG